MTATATRSYPYICQVDIAFPTAEHAENTKKVMEVDEEIGDRVQREFSLVQGTDTEELVVMRIRFQATEAKMLRVSISTFYDYLKVALKCIQEFEPEGI